MTSPLGSYAIAVVTASVNRTNVRYDLASGDISIIFLTGSFF